MSCPFCEIAAQRSPAKKLAENDFAIAFLPLEVEAPGHFLVIPKVHVEDFSQCPTELFEPLMHFIQTTTKSLCEKFGFDGYNLLNANGASAEQSVSHLHVHIILRRPNDDINAWPSLQPTESAFIGNTL